LALACQMAGHGISSSLLKITQAKVLEPALPELVPDLLQVRLVIE
jgi:hypothetical protein